MDAKHAAAAGAIATATTTCLWLIEPSIGLPQIAMGQMLSTAMSVSTAQTSIGAAGGWIVHFAVGIALTLIYAAFLVDRLPGSPLMRGAAFGVIVFVLAQVAFMPLVGGGLFSRGDVQLLAGSLLGHLVYGLVAAWIYASAAPRREAATVSGVKD